MELKTMQAVLTNTDPRRAEFVKKYQESLDYYNTKTKITAKHGGNSHSNSDGKDQKDLVRKADNRVPSNYHQLLVDQEAGYVATTPPDIDLKSDPLNKLVQDTLGDDFALVLNQLVIDAALAGTAWLHYWKDDDGLHYAPVPPDQVTPIYTSDLSPRLEAVRRTYQELNTDTGDTYNVHEYWTDTTVTVFKSKGSDYGTLEPYSDRFNYVDATSGEDVGTGNVLEHGLGRIPFIEFDKNRYKLPELHKYKGYIDTYDMIYNGLINDLQDIQQVIMILTNYGGASLDDLRKSIKEGAIKVESNGAGDNSGLDTLKIDIPTDAKELALELSNKKIFKFGQGIDPDDFLVKNNATGPALKMLYSHLELKASITEKYFRRGINELIDAILRNNKQPDNVPIIQTWHRSAIQNDLEQSQVLQNVAPFTSKQTLAKSNPLVQDWQAELKQRDDDEVDDGFNNDDELNRLKEQMNKNKQKED